MTGVQTCALPISVCVKKSNKVLEELKYIDETLCNSSNEATVKLLKKYIDTFKSNS